MAGLSTFDTFKNSDVDGAAVIDVGRLRDLQTCLAGILGDVFGFCSRHSITCILGGGTALGAVRSGGFIPWDDDADVALPRRDFDRFLELFRDECGDRYDVIAPSDKPTLGLCLARIRLKGTRCLTREDIVASNPRDGVFIDAFAIENVPDSRLLRMLHGFVSMAIGFAYSCRKFYRERKILRKWRTDGGTSRVFRAKSAIGFLAAFLPMRAWVLLWDWWNSLLKNRRTKMVGIPVGRKHYFGEIARREDLCETRPIMFEGVECRCARDCEGYLARLYGKDFMTPPADGWRERHTMFEPLIVPHRKEPS